jgi:copper chaperone NosL
MKREGLESRPARLLAIASLLFSACGSAASGPPSIVLDRTSCAGCGMLVSDLRFAAAYRTEEGEELVFDDIGCFLRNLPAAGASRVWVKDYETSEWVDGETAFYVRSRAVETPMSGGIVAFASREAAERHEGELLRFADLKESSARAQRARARERRVSAHEERSELRSETRWGWGGSALKGAPQ